MPNYYRSLEERKLAIFEGACAECGDGEDQGDGSGDMANEDDGDTTKLMSFLSKYKKKKGKK